MGLPRRRPGKSDKSRTPARAKTVAKPRAPARPKLAPPPASPPPAPAPVATPATLDAALADAWSALTPSTQQVGAVTLRFVRHSGQLPWFHVVTRGFAPHGFELSFRAPVGWVGAPLPDWCAPLMAALGPHVASGALEPGQCVELGPFAGPESELAAVVAVHDVPLMKAQEAPPFPVLLLVGITADEARQVRSWSPQGLLEVLAKVDPLLLTDAARPSLLLSPRARAVIEQRAQKEGSSMAVVRATTSEAKKAPEGITWRLDLNAAQTVVALLQGRLGHQRSFQVLSQGLTCDVLSADAPSVALKGRSLSLKLNLTAARAMRARLKGPGRFTWEEIPGLTIEVLEAPAS